MKQAYPVIMRPVEAGYLVSIPDFDAMTEGKDMVDAMEMARDCIGLGGITLEDFGREIPKPSDIKQVQEKLTPGDVLTFVDIDFSAYREAVDSRSVRKNLTIPLWLDRKAEQAGVNFSKVLQEALIERLDVRSMKP